MRPDDVGWSLLGFHINTPHIFAQYADTYELQAAYEEHGSKQRGVAGYIGPHDKGAQQYEYAVAETDKRTNAPQVGPHPQR